MSEIILRSTLSRVPDGSGRRWCRACRTPAIKDETHCRTGCFYERITFHGFALDAIRRGDSLPTLAGSEAIRALLARAPRPGEA